MGDLDTKIKARQPTPRFRSWTTAIRSSSSRSAGSQTNDFHGQKVGNIAHLEAGTVVGGKFYPKGKNDPVPLSQILKLESTPRPGNGHFGNFIAAVRSRKVEDLNADILEGHYSAALCHLANVSYRLGQEVPFNKSTGAFGDDKEAYETFARMEEHLKNDGVALDGLNYRLGRKLTFDAATESFPGDAEANAASHQSLSPAVRRAGKDHLSRGSGTGQARRSRQAK